MCGICLKFVLKSILVNNFYITKQLCTIIVKKQNEFLQSDQGTLTLHSHVVYDYLL